MDYYSIYGNHGFTKFDCRFYYVWVHGVWATFRVWDIRILLVNNVAWLQERSRVRHRQGAGLVN